MLAIDRIDEAWEVARQYHASLAADFAGHPYFQAIPYLRAYVARGVNLAAARPLLSDAIEKSSLASDHPRQLELLALRAWLELQTGEEDVAHKTLLRAEELVARTGYVRVLLDIPALAALTPAEGCDDKTVAAPLAKGKHLLTEQEQAVLTLLADDRTYAQVAGELVISINTVRTHVRHIYKKLAVHRRDQAIRRARELGLLRP